MVKIIKDLKEFFRVEMMSWSIYNTTQKKRRVLTASRRVAFDWHLKHSEFHRKFIPVRIQIYNNIKKLFAKKIPSELVSLSNESKKELQRTRYFNGYETVYCEPKEIGEVKKLCQ